MKPIAVFLDTSIFDGQNYNFDSTAFKSYLEATKADNIPLLLPNATEREIKRHIKQRSEEASKLLIDFEKKVPFAREISAYKEAFSTRAPEWQLRMTGTRQLNDFLKSAKVLKLDYSTVDLEKVMDWYDAGDAPFGPGKKKKEFPDAFALSTLVGYLEKTPNSCIAVVASDTDFKVACARYPSLLYFSSLPRLTETLLTSTGRLSDIQSIISASNGIIEDAIDEFATNLDFEHENSKYSVVDSNNHGSISLTMQVIGLGDNECTIAFEAEFEAEVELAWMELVYAGRNEELEPDERRGWVTTYPVLTGAVKAKYDDKAKIIAEVTLVDVLVANTDIHEEPRHSY